MTLPEGFRVRLTRGVDQGPMLVGGSPLTVMRLSDRARALMPTGVITVADEATRHIATRLLATNLGHPDLHDVEHVDPAELTVVIPVRDRAEQLDRALAALRPLRCIVVDDASHEPHQVAEVVHRWGARLVRLAVNAGPAGARNAGWAAAATPYVAFVDSDVEAPAAALLQLTRHFADPAVCLVGPRVRGVARSARPAWFERYDEVASSLDLGTTPSIVEPGAAVAWLPSACLVARRESLGSGFDTALRVGEDVDLVWRLSRAGHRVRFDPSVEVRHDARATLTGWLGRKFAYGSGGAPLAARHGGKVAPAVLTAPYAIAALALLLHRRTALPIAAVAVASGTRSVRRALPATPGREVLSVRLSARGLGWAVRQESALLLRHWAPLAIAGAVASRRVRRALAGALVVDVVVMMAEHRNEPRIGPAAIIAARRLDDLAYGSGLWWGALRSRSVRALLPRRPRAAPPLHQDLLKRWLPMPGRARGGRVRREW